MNKFEHNMQMMKMHKNYLYMQLENVNVNSAMEEHITTLEARDGTPILSVEKNQQVYRMNSAYRPLEEADKWLEQFSFYKPQLRILMFGLGSGIFTRTLLARLKEDDYLFIYEPSLSIFLYVLYNFDLSDIITDHRIAIFVENINGNEFSDILKQYIKFMNINSQIVCIHPQYNKLYGEMYKKFLRIISDNMNLALVERNTEGALGEVWVNNLLNNLSYIFHGDSFDEYINLFPKDVPAIIVSAGPSLDKNIESLKYAKGKAVIIAVDTAIKYLYEKGIEPDFTVLLDANKSLRHFNNPYSKEVPMFCEITSNHKVLDIHQGKKIFYGEDKYLQSLVPEKNKKLCHGGSVATVAFTICEELGFERIILVGQDLAFSGEHTHAGNVVFNMLDINEETIRYVEDINGDIIKTRYDWYNYLLWFHDAVRKFKGKEVIDATEGGAKIQGTTIMPLSIAIEKYCTKTIDCKLYTNQIPNKNKDQWNKKIIDILNKCIYDLSDIKKKSNKAIYIVNELLKEYKTSMVESYRGRNLSNDLLSINKELKNRPIQTLIDTYSAKQNVVNFLDIYQFTKDERENKLFIYSKAKRLYQSYADSCDEVREIIEYNIKKLENK